MSNSRYVWALALLGTTLAIPVYAAETLVVRIIDRQDSASEYTYVVPGVSSTSASANVACTSYGASANCSGTGRGTTVSTPAFVASYVVKGATLTLELLDGRRAVVNCDSKVNWSEWSNPNMYRNCRAPLVDELEATFTGDKAKLKWVVSIDGKTKRTETYKILAVLPKPAAQATSESEQ